MLSGSRCTSEWSGGQPIARPAPPPWAHSKDLLGRSILVGAEHLAAVARRERLIDSVELPVQIVDPGIAWSAHRNRTRVPRIDRVLDEPNRTIAEREVAATRMHAGGRH